MRYKAAGFVLALVATIVATAPNVASSTGYSCDGRPATIVVEESGTVTIGTDGDDVIVGTFGDDEILGGGGNDTICGHAGNDILRGGHSDDHIQGGNDEDHVLGGGGNDVLFGGNGNDIVNGQAGTDIVLGEAGNDRLIGDPTVDTLWPGPGNDEVIEISGPHPNPVPPSDSTAPDDSPTPGDTAPTFDGDAPLLTDRVATLDAGVFTLEAGGTPFNIEVPDGWRLLENSSVLGVFAPTDSPDFFVNDVLVKRANALSNPDEAGMFLHDQDAPFDVADIDAWIAAAPQEIFTAAPEATTFAGRDAVTFGVRIDDDSICQEGPVCLAFAGNVTAFDTYSFEPNVDYTVWVVDMGEFDPVLVLLSDNGNSPSITAQGRDVANSIVFDEPQPNPLPIVEAPWEIGGRGEAEPGVIEFPLAGGVAIDIPEASITGAGDPGVFFVTMGTLPIPGDVELFSPVSDAFGNAIETAADFIAAGEVADFTATEVGTAETRLGSATVIDIEGGNFSGGPLLTEPTPADVGIIAEAGSQLGWRAPTFGRAWLIESERGLIVFTAELFVGEREDLDPFIAYAESLLPSLRFVGEPDGALPRLATDVGFMPVPAGDYILNFEGTNPILVQTVEESVLIPAGVDLIAVEPPALASPDGLPVGVAFLDVNEVFTNNDGDTAPVPDDIEAFFEGDARVIVEASGTLEASGVEARWWDVAPAPGAGEPRGDQCPFGNCVPIFANQTAGGDIVIGADFEFRVFEIADPDGTAYAVAQAPPESNAALLEFAESVLSGLEVLPIPVIPEFEPGDLFGFSEGDTLAPGTYFANDAFSVPLQLELTQERRFGIATDSLIGIQAVDFAFSDTFQAIEIVEPTTGLAAPDAIGGPDGRPESFIDFPSDLTDWVSEIPQIELLDSGSREISGVQANFVDISIVGAPERNGDCGGTPCLALFESVLGPAVVIEGSTLRIYVVQLPETTMLVTIQSGADDFDAFAADVQSLIDGITLG